MPVRCTTRLFPTASALIIAVSAALAQAPAKPSPLVPANPAQLPATAPTNLTAPLAVQMNGAAAKRPQRANVTYAGGLLDVRANDSSLNSILREIGRLTGMKISGGVADQRVFGDYGPAEPSVVLATLLDGTGTNLFLKESADNSPAELILTPRNGGPTPPSPSSSEYSDNDEPPTAQPGNNSSAGNRALPGVIADRPGNLPGQRPGNGNPYGSTSPLPSAFQNSGVLGDPSAVSPSASTMPVTNSAPVDSLPVPATAQSPDGIVSSPSGPPTGTTTAGFNAAAQTNAASPVTPTNDADTTGSTVPGGSTNADGSGAAPNGVKTPEQIFQQLQQLRLANQAQMQGQPGSTTTPPPTTPATPQGTTKPQ